MDWGGNMIIGITGSIGCGKSYAVNEFLKIAQAKNISALAINIDEVRREILAGDLHLKSLYEQAYCSKQNMQDFKKEFLPVLKNNIQQIILANSQKLILLEWALLFEDKLDFLCDFFVLVNCKVKTQIQRLKNGDLGLQKIKQRIKCQLSNKQKLKLIKQSKKQFVVLNTDKNPSQQYYLNVFENILSKAEDYSFCLFKIPNNGGRVLWEITNMCNYNCAYCIFSSSAKKITNELSTLVAKRTIKDLKKNGFSYIKFTGGEPFVRSDMVELLKFASKNQFQMDISTNASLITDDIAQQLAKINLNYVHVSLDGQNKNIHESVRGENTFDRTVRGINLLIKNGIYTRLGCLIHKQNQDSLEDVISFACKLRANEIIFSFMEPIGRLSKDSDLVSNLTICEAETILSELKEKYLNKIKVSYSFTTDNRKSCLATKCPALNKFVFIDNLGYVSPCTWLVDKYPQFKSEINLKTNTLKKVLNCNACKSFKKAFDSFEPNICPAKKR